MITIANSPHVEGLAFAAKTIHGKKLFTRNTGIRYACVVGVNTIEYTVTYTNCKMDGLEFLNCEFGDTANLEVWHPQAGKVGQFGYNTNLPDGFYHKKSKYDADLSAGLIIKIIYTSISQKTIGINFDLHEVV
jgi:hypothetical protein